MMTSIQNQIDDESIFPTSAPRNPKANFAIEAGVEFSKDFLPTVKQIFKHFLRLFAHIYHHHYDTILNLEQEVRFMRDFDHVKGAFKHALWPRGCVWIAARSGGQEGSAVSSARSAR